MDKRGGDLKVETSMKLIALNQNLAAKRRKEKRKERKGKERKEMEKERKGKKRKEKKRKEKKKKKIRIAVNQIKKEKISNL